MTEVKNKEKEYYIDYRFIVKADSYYMANRYLALYLPEANDDIWYTIIKGRENKRKVD